MKRFLTLLLLLPLACMSLSGVMYGYAQEVKLGGVVTDGTTGMNLRGVNIVVENSFYGTITNESGNFRISMSSISLPILLTFEHAGYTRTQLKVTTPGQELKIALKPLGVTEKKQQDASAEMAEYRLKINLLRLFAEKVDWAAPVAASQPFVIALIGYNPFGDDLYAFEKIQLKGRPVKVVFLGDATEITDQDMLVVSKPGRKLQEEIQQQLAGKHVLTICDKCEAGAFKPVITLETAEGKVRFRLSEDAARAADLTLGAELKKAAFQ